MTPLDVVLVIVLVIAVSAGLTRGILATVGGLVGLVAGALAALWAVPWVNDALPSPEWRGPVAVVLTIALPILGASAGGGIGHRLREGVDRTPLGPLERLLGGAAHLVVAALALSFAGGTLAVTGSPAVAAGVSSSSVLRTVDELTPPAVGRSLAQARAFVLDDGLPTVDGLLTPRPAGQIPDADLDDPALEAAAASVARVSGVAYACGASSTGTGFVVAPDRVVTNAHVVAGVSRPVVELPGGAAVPGRVVYYDPVDDLAVVATDGLGAAPLPLAPALDAGDPAVVQGYPYGGPFTSVSAGVLAVQTARVPDVYGMRAAPREIYALDGEVHPGNSGGPVLTTTGAVAGVVFAKAEDRESLGYAMTTAELRPVATRAAGMDEAVRPGQCAR